MILLKTNKLLLFYLLICCATFSLQAQEYNMLHLDLGGGIATHQNQTFSKKAMNGGGAALQLGFHKQKNNIFDINLNMQYEILNIASLSYTKSSIINPSLSIGWLKGLGNKKGFDVFVGAETDFDFLMRTTLKLGNNQRSLMYNGTLYAAVQANKRLGSSNWYINGGYSLGLLSWVKTNDGYGFSAPQDLLTDGDFSYDVSGNILSPFKYGRLEPLWNFNTMKTHISLLKHGRRVTWGVKYDWRIKSYKPFTDGLFVNGGSDILFVFGYHFGSKKSES